MRSDVVYNVFINIKVHTAPSLIVEVNSVNTALKNNAFFFFFLCLQVHSDGQSLWHQMHWKSQISWNSGKRVQRKRICLNPILLFLIGELVNFECENYWNLTQLKLIFTVLFNFTNTTSQKFLNSKIFNVFKEASSAHQACIYLIQSTAKQFWFFLLFKINVFYLNIF